MTDTLPHPDSPAMRKAATDLILQQLAELLHQEHHWLSACRKRIKDRMADAKHILFNNDLKLRLIERQLNKSGAADTPPVHALIREHQTLADKNQQLRLTAHVCALALQLLDQQTQAAAPTPPKRKLEAVTPPKTFSS